MNPAKMHLVKIMALLILGTTIAQAQLNVSVAPPKTSGNKTLVKLEMVNGFSETVESARAACFLLDERGKMIGQTTQWVIGGTKDRPPLKPGTTNVFHFVVPTSNLVSTNLATKITFSRVILEGGRMADVRTAVQISDANEQKK